MLQPVERIRWVANVTRTQAQSRVKLGDANARYERRVFYEEKSVPQPQLERQTGSDDGQVPKVRTKQSRPTAQVVRQTLFVT